MALHVLHDWDGALANERGWHRMGADAVARDATGGAEGVAEDRGGQPKMRVARYTSVFAVFFLVASSAS